jgi:2-oxo-3-hexenedioate decarboxylase
MQNTSNSSLSDLAILLDQAAQNVNPIDQLSLTSTFTETEAYEIQRLSMEERYARGEKLVGLKLGFTSYAKMEQMGVHDMIWGRLTDTMLISKGDSISMSRFIHARAEPEICFRISQDINREITIDEARDFVDGIAPAIEIIDSRYQNFKFSLEDVIADNCSSSAFVVGDWLDVTTPIVDLVMSLSMNGEISEKGSSSDILGNPWLSVVNAARLGVKYNEPLKKGHYLMAGAATPAVFLQSPMEVSANVENLGSIHFRTA